MLATTCKAELHLVQSAPLVGGGCPRDPEPRRHAVVLGKFVRVEAERGAFTAQPRQLAVTER